MLGFFSSLRRALEVADRRDVDGGTCAARACVPRYKWVLAASGCSSFLSFLGLEKVEGLLAFFLGDVLPM